MALHNLIPVVPAFPKLIHSTLWHNGTDHSAFLERSNPLDPLVLVHLIKLENAKEMQIVFHFITMLKKIQSSPIIGISTL